MEETSPPSSLLVQLKAEKLPDEILMSNTETSSDISEQVAAGQLRQLGPGLYTPNMTDDPASIVKRNLWQIVALYCPGAVVADRTAFENRRAIDGSICVVHSRERDVELPGLRIRPRFGPGPTEEDRPFMRDLYLASSGRALLENLASSGPRSWDRSEVSRTLSRSEVETRLEQVLSRFGPHMLKKWRDQARRLAPTLGLEAQLAELEHLIGPLLETGEDPEISAPTALARITGRPYDAQRLELFEALRLNLGLRLPEFGDHCPVDAPGGVNLPFFDAYFSSFIEGIEFDVDTALAIVFLNVIPTDHMSDAHDLLGAWRLTSYPRQMQATPKTFEDLVSLLKRRHTLLMNHRSDKKPGEFKDRRNQVGGRYFVDPGLVVGTLEKGFDIYQSLKGAFERAAFIHYLIAEVHPFLDGNGRIARIFMNAELVAASQQRIIIPTVYRDNYLSALQALSNSGIAEPYLRMLAFAQRYTRTIPWNSLRARHLLTATHAFMRAGEAEARGVRFRLPTAEQLQAAEDAKPLRLNDG